MRSARESTAFSVAALAMFLLAGLALGQQVPDKRLQEFQRRMNLTSEQTEQIRPILEDEAKKLQEIRAKYQGDASRRGRRQLFRELRAVQQDAQKRIGPILTLDQKAEWKKIRAERRKELREHRRQ